MGDGGLQCDINVKKDFSCVSPGAPPLKPVMVYPVKPGVAQEVVKNLSAIQGRTDDSEIVQRPGANGGTQYAFVDKRNGQPLAALQEEGGQYTLALYKSPADLATRIDSFFVSEAKINDFVRDSQMPTQIAQLQQPSLN